MERSEWILLQKWAYFFVLRTLGFVFQLEFPQKKQHPFDFEIPPQPPPQYHQKTQEQIKEPGPFNLKKTGGKGMVMTHAPLKFKIQ